MISPFSTTMALLVLFCMNDTTTSLQLPVGVQLGDTIQQQQQEKLLTPEQNSNNKFVQKLLLGSQKTTGSKIDEDEIEKEVGFNSVAESAQIGIGEEEDGGAFRELVDQGVQTIADRAGGLLGNIIMRALFVWTGPAAGIIVERVPPISAARDALVFFITNLIYGILTTVTVFMFSVVGVLYGIAGIPVQIIG